MAQCRRTVPIAKRSPKRILPTPAQGDSARSLAPPVGALSAHLAPTHAVNHAMPADATTWVRLSGAAKRPRKPALSLAKGTFQRAQFGASWSILRGLLRTAKGASGWGTAFETGSKPEKGSLDRQRRLEALPDLKASTETTVVDRVAASFVYEGTHKGLYYGVAPTTGGSGSPPATFSAWPMERSSSTGAWAPAWWRSSRGDFWPRAEPARPIGWRLQWASSARNFPKSSPGGHSLPSAHFFPCSGRFSRLFLPCYVRNISLLFSLLRSRANI